MTGRAAQHRHDLDGLRGIAIALVALYHVYGDRVSGGVDVFLTLSGFFLALSLLSQAGRLREGWGGLGRGVLGAWWRIARRLLPGAAFTIAGTLVAGAFVLPRSRWEETLDQAWAALTYYANWFLIANDRDYEAAGQAASPFQHFWSLAVQGQAFVAVLGAGLLIVWLLRRHAERVRRGVLLAMFAGAAVASFGWAVAQVARDQPAAYYDTFARGWEILAGAALGLAWPRVSAVLRRLPEWLMAGSSWLALAMVVSCGFLIDGAMAFPGWPTWLPVGATLLLICSGDVGGRWNAAGLLATRQARWLGDHAYALYLWHWPVLILFLAGLGQERVGWDEGIVVLVISLFGAMATKRFVEDPIRSGPDDRGLRRWARPVAACGVGVSAVLTVTAVVVLDGHQDRELQNVLGEVRDAARYPGAAVVAGGPGQSVALADAPIVDGADDDRFLPPPHLARADRPRGLEPGCRTRAPERQVYRCPLHEGSSGKVVVLVGGSHSIQLIPGLREIVRRQDVTLVGYLALGCPWGGRPLLERLPPRVRANREDCRRWSDEVTDLLIDKDPDLIIGTATRPEYPLATAGDTVPRAYTSTWSRAVEHGLELVMIRDNPWLPYDVVECVEAQLPASIAAINTACGIHRSKVLSDPSPTAAVEMPGLNFVDLSDDICRPDYCNVIEGNILIYRDDNHMTASFTRTLAAAIDRQLAELVPWWHAS